MAGRLLLGMTARLSHHPRSEKHYMKDVTPYLLGVTCCSLNSSKNLPLTSAPQTCSTIAVRWAGLSHPVHVSCRFHFPTSAAFWHSCLSSWRLLHATWKRANNNVREPSLLLLQTRGVPLFQVVPRKSEKSPVFMDNYIPLCLRNSNLKAAIELLGIQRPKLLRSSLFKLPLAPQGLHLHRSPFPKSFRFA